MISVKDASEESRIVNRVVLAVVAVVALDSRTHAILEHIVSARCALFSSSTVIMDNRH
jgi:hypothetical protein